MNHDLKKRYLGFTAMLLCYGSAIISFFLPKEMKDTEDLMMKLCILLAFVLFGLFFYYNRTQWKRFLFWIILMSVLYITIMWLSKPMLEHSDCLDRAERDYLNCKS